MRYALAADVGLEASGDAIYLAPLPDGPILVLDGVAALIFTEATQGDREYLVDRVIGQVAGPAEDIASHVDAFLDDLVARGLLVEEAT
ncbi:PqqD family peptide modification chaperone [Agromyces bracchium]|uniref:PqqD family peptide modification chaperone n=1 Tax=Agromyces bracchium TaxID=88376 RepID=A0A6I3M490_9MICO|nr:PqqD family peptide modification chaperone [Agromyces bracchium]MTH66902.1 PqqD family peptide modification chaperone [Agromyces bracchium]